MIHETAQYTPAYQEMMGQTPLQNVERLHADPHYVPTREDLYRQCDVVAEAFKDLSDDEAAAATEHMKWVSPNYWRLDDDQIDAAIRVTQLKNPAKLTEKDCLDFVSKYAADVQDNPQLKPEDAFTLYKDELKKRLALHEELKDLFTDEDNSQNAGATSPIQNEVYNSGESEAKPSVTGDGNAHSSEVVESYVVRNKDKASIEVTAEQSTTELLTDAERSELAEVIGLRSANQLSERMKLLMQRLSDDPHKESKVAQFKRLKEQAYARLSSDAKNREGSNPTPAAEPAAIESGKKSNVSHKRDNIADLVSLDTNGRAHYDSGKNAQTGASLKGRFMTAHELDMIVEHQDLIRTGYADRKAEAEHLKENMPEGFADKYGITEEQWKTVLTPDERAKLVAHDAELEKAAKVTDQDLAEPQGRARRMMGWAKEKLQFAKETVYTRGENLGPERKRVIVGVALGAFAVGTAAATIYAMKNGAGAHEAAALAPAKPAGPATDPSLLSVKPKAEAAPVQEYITTKLEKGSNLWKLAKEQLSKDGHTPTNAEIDAYDRALAKLNGIDLAKGDDRRMAVGSVIRMFKR